MPTALDFKSTLEGSSATSWGQILETMVMGNWGGGGGGGGVNEVHFCLVKNGRFLSFSFLVFFIIKLRNVNILKSVFLDTAINQ